MSYSNQTLTHHSDADFRKAIADSVRAMQFVTFIMAQGAIVVWGIFLFVGEGATDGQPDVIGWGAVGIAGFMFVLHLLLPGFIQNSALQKLKGDEYRAASFEDKVGRVMVTFQSKQVMTLAMLEAASILNAVAYLLNPWVGNIIAGAVMIVLILARMPLASSLLFKVQGKMRELELG